MINITLPSVPRDTSQRIKVNHVFECEGCGLYWLGGELVKIDGKRKCNRCLMAVQDITFTENAQVWLTYVGVSATDEETKG